MYFIILDGFLPKQPLPQVLSVLHTIFHVLAVQDNDDEPSSFGLDTACQTGACSVGDSCLYSNI
jgi:hypothetical protein